MDSECLAVLEAEVLLLGRQVRRRSVTRGLCGRVESRLASASSSASAWRSQEGIDLSQSCNATLKSKLSGGAVSTWIRASCQDRMALTRTFGESKANVSLAALVLDTENKVARRVEYGFDTPTRYRVRRLGENWTNRQPKRLISAQSHWLGLMTCLRL